MSCRAWVPKRGSFGLGKSFAKFVSVAQNLLLPNFPASSISGQATLYPLTFTL